MFNPIDLIEIFFDNPIACILVLIGSIATLKIVAMFL